MNRDYDRLLPRVLVAMFPNEDSRREIVRKLSIYGTESFHQGRARVHLGILKLGQIYTFESLKVRYCKGYGLT